MTAVLREMLLSANEFVRRDIAEILGMIGGAHAVAILTDLLQDEVRVRYAAVEALGRISDPQTIPALKRMLWDQESWIRNAAATALGRLGVAPK